MATVMREKFDSFLVNKAVEQGAVFQGDTKFLSPSGSVGDLRVETSRETFNARYIVGADGVTGKACGMLGLRVRRKAMYALEGEVFPDHSDLLRDFRGSVHFDFGFIPYGYGWVFPKKSQLSVGVLTRSKKVKDLKKYLVSYMKYKGVYEHADIRSLSGHQIPFGPHRRNTLANYKGLLVGDSAGLADPLTGEGLFYAVMEAWLASKVITHALNSGDSYMLTYNNLVSKELMHDALCTQRIAGVFYDFPAFSYRVLKAHGQRLGAPLLDIIMGKKTYREVQRQMLRPSNLLSLVASRHSLHAS
jgi:flavin-dependent dehydrogenase